ncbi:hypothetical protein FD684_10550 [Neisseria meningitidis]|nr:hypothetical protein FD684_10550 [Neisseria meningitidis]TRD13230.1 hypothetical protein FD860_10495 [Neisseria meningitidis]
MVAKRQRRKQIRIDCRRCRSAPQILICKDWYQQKACRQTGFFLFGFFLFSVSLFSVWLFPVFSLFYSMSKYAVIPAQAGI